MQQRQRRGEAPRGEEGYEPVVHGGVNLFFFASLRSTRNRMHWHVLKKTNGGRREEKKEQRGRNTTGKVERAIA